MPSPIVKIAACALLLAQVSCGLRGWSEAGYAMASGYQLETCRKQAINIEERKACESKNAMPYKQYELERQKVLGASQ